MMVSLHVWRLPRRAVPAAFARMAADPFRLRRVPGVRFAKLLGTGTGTGFGPGDADLTRFAAVMVWDGQPDPALFGGWDKLAAGSARVDLEPLVSRGRWSGREPFGNPAGGKRKGMVLALTRARLRPAKALTFWSAVPPVARELHAAPGLLARFGIGEAPVGWQGTVSVWRDTTDLTAFAYRQPEHRAVIARTPADRWYAEDLFARFAVLDITGDKAVLGWQEERRREEGER